MKKVLIISYYWPPSGDSGVQRWMYFSHYFKKMGVEPVVLTIDPKKATYLRIDESLSNFVADIETHKTAGFDLLKMYSFLKSGNKQKSVPQGEVAKKGFLNTVARYVRGNFFIPDARVGWKKRAVKKAKELVDKNDFDLVITTGPPHSTHLIGLDLKKKFPNLKWLADFRDPWIDIFYYNDFIRSNRARNKDKNLEYEVLSKADLVSTVGPNLQLLLENKVEVTQKAKFFHVYNGFDAEKLKRIKKRAKDENVFRMVYVGLLTEHQPYQVFLDEVQKAKNTYSGTKIWQIDLYGKIDEKIIAAFQQLDGISINYHGPVKHEVALDGMNSADLLLITLPNQKNSKLMVSGKLMEYYATGNPILFIGDVESDGANILKSARNTFLYAENESLESKMVDNILKCAEMDLFEERDINRFSRRELSKEIISKINSRLS